MVDDNKPANVKDEKPADTAKADAMVDVNGDPQHWLVKPLTIKLLWVFGIALLAYVTWLGTTVHPHSKFGIEGTLGFYSWYGFATCFAMVIFAKLLGLILSRKDTYYDK